ncbi:flagellar brake protein [Caldimonas tepidiphila]|uniref:flagellar brake protein n=1 Tax=Caldimonas tepidiphila TaxID=2315841 RepID=UPI001F0C333B|nr:flagellar brake protein [Caldimonas tepidiphila]
MSPDALPSPASGDFRISEPLEVAALLRELVRQRALLTIAAPDGASYTTLLWEFDAERGLLRFSAGDHDDPGLARVLDATDAVAVGYLERIKVQFDVNGLVLVHTATGDSALNCALPAGVFRFQRRNAFRVRPLAQTEPTARFAHPLQREVQLALRVLDVSIGGVALFLPDGAPQVPPGTKLDRVELELDGDTRFDCGLRVHHLTGINAESRGVRLGCEIEGISSAGLRMLQRFIDLTQRRRRTMAFDAG